VRRAADVLAALVGLVVAAPILAAAAIAIRVTMGRPVLFRQTRSGLHGTEFTVLKLRTMRDAKPHEVDHTYDADRLTRLGAFLRATSIDELPQLWNVLRGEMSLIGPRPTLPEQVAHYTPRPSASSSTCGTSTTAPCGSTCASWHARSRGCCAPRASPARRASTPASRPPRASTRPSRPRAITRATPTPTPAPTTTVPNLEDGRAPLTRTMSPMGHSPRRPHHGARDG